MSRDNTLVKSKGPAARRHLPLIVSVAMAGWGMSGVSPAFANSHVEHYVGTAYDLAGRELYTESHWINEAVGYRELLVLFTCPDGTPFARKQVRETGVAQAPSFTLEDARTGYREGVREGGASREVFVRPDGVQPEKSAPLNWVPGLVVDAGFDSFIREHWEGLATGSRQRLDFLVPSRLRAYPFTLSLLDEALKDGKPVRRFLLELDTWYAFAIPSIILMYRSDTRKILEYQGVANIRDHDGKSLSVRIAYSTRPGENMADSNSMLEARTARLSGNCRL